jgi:hypothetical protein
LHALTVRATGLRTVQCKFEAAEGRQTEAQVETRGDRRPACGLEEGRLIVSLTLPPNRPGAGAAETSYRGLPDERKHAALSRDVLANRPREDNKTQRVLGWTLGGAGVLALGSAAYFGIRAMSLVSDADCDAQHRCSQAGVNTISRASEAQTAGFALGGVGAALVAGGVALLLLGGDPSRRGGRPGQTIVVQVLPRGASLGATW